MGSQVVEYFSFCFILVQECFHLNLKPFGKLCLEHEDVSCLHCNFPIGIKAEVFPEMLTFNKSSNNMNKFILLISLTSTLAMPQGK